MDNLADYFNAVKSHLQAVNVLCMVHTINLAVRKGLALPHHVNKSTIDCYLLEAKQKQLGVKPAKLINDCPTRWNKADTSGSAFAIEAVLQQEMLIYERETQLPANSNPLPWWKTSSSRDPHLAQHYLSIPGRTSSWWDNFVNGVVVDEEWRENFRMSKTSLVALSEELRPYIQRQTTAMRAPIETIKRVALTLYYLSDEGRLRKTANAVSR
ncbi:hypothetical protein N1851_003746 [Merluccius polli]|uniref:Uncharacterized protein n=1 Tax=Merluccius polli TaxID=89951 RepID=A0AA47N981_MERPO|nr:hypothetical protein N1851_003746 [Merluccius polli]